MSKPLLPLFALLAAGLCALPALADPLAGRWRVPAEAGGGAIVELQLCGDLICGSFVEDQGAGAPLGQPAVSGMEPRGSGQYRNGEVFELARGRNLPARMELQGSRLAVTTCQRMACRDQIWTRN